MTQPRSWSRVRAPATTAADWPVAPARARRSTPGRRAATARRAARRHPGRRGRLPGVHRPPGVRPCRSRRLADGRPPGQSATSPRSTHAAPRRPPAAARATRAAGPDSRPSRHPTDGPCAANTGRPCSRACRAVISAPLPTGASMTTVATLRPLMIRLRRGNVPLVGTVSGGCSPTMAPSTIPDGARQRGMRPRPSVREPAADHGHGAAPDLEASSRARHRRCPSRGR